MFLDQHMDMHGMRDMDHVQTEEINMLDSEASQFIYYFGYIFIFSPSTRVHLHIRALSCS